MDREIRQRLQWVHLYEQTQHAGLVCRRCGISRPILRKWWRRYQANGMGDFALLALTTGPGTRFDRPDNYQLMTQSVITFPTE